ncbi:hypothetical protein QBC45DRAFT_2820 [Copromyces sp. CBS 386.78]|nr:hypothetical protein QBC45DRAFT_2820 [Copromyces sp. CBS 386.78]
MVCGGGVVCTIRGKRISTNRHLRYHRRPKENRGESRQTENGKESPSYERQQPVLLSRSEGNESAEGALTPCSARDPPSFLTSHASPTYIEVRNQNRRPVRQFLSPTEPTASVECWGLGIESFANIKAICKLKSHFPPLEIRVLDVLPSTPLREPPSLPPKPQPRANGERKQRHSDPRHFGQPIAKGCREKSGVLSFWTSIHLGM